MIAILTRLGAALLVIYAGCIGLALAAGASMPKEVVLFTSSRANGTYNLYLLDIRAGLTRKLSDYVMGLCCPVWSPDGETLLLPANAFETYVMDWDGSDFHLVPEMDDDLIQPWPLDDSTILSPDYEQYGYIARPDEQPDLYIRRTDGTDERRLTTSEALEMFPSWSPDGTRILFASEQDGSMELYTVDVADGSLTRLTYNSATDWNPAWSPDGTRIVFASDRDGDAEIYVMNADGTNQRRLTFNPAVDAYPSWQP